MVRLEAGNRAGNYMHIFGNRLLGQLIADTHSAMIRMGNMLEKIVLEECGRSGALIGDFDRFIDECETDAGAARYQNRVMVLSKKIAKRSRKLQSRMAEPDFVVFVMEKRECRVIELKLGTNFDTKKSQGEAEALREAKTRLGTIVPFKVNDYVCSFMAGSHKDIVAGFKGKITEGQAMTGREFCALLGLDYAEIRSRFESDASYNREAFAQRILSIPEMLKIIRGKISG